MRNLIMWMTLINCLQPVDEKEGTIPDEWISRWWVKQLERGLPGEKVADMFGGISTDRRVSFHM
jgi:hypothetical protein